MPEKQDNRQNRLQCIAIDCNRSIGEAAWRKRFGDLDFSTADYICQKHWSFIPEKYRKIYARIRRRERRYGVRLPGSFRIWRRMMREITNGYDSGQK